MYFALTNAELEEKLVHPVWSAFHNIRMPKIFENTSKLDDNTIEASGRRCFSASKNASRRW